MEADCSCRDSEAFEQIAEASAKEAQALSSPKHLHLQWQETLISLVAKQQKQLTKYPAN